MLAPVAQKLLTPVVGADAALIWFGVMLCVNMQTSFMHPPFGFALFYLRSVAPKEVKSSDIYWGAIPWVVLQIIMVANRPFVVSHHGTVTVIPRQAAWLDPRQGSNSRSSPSKVKIEHQPPMFRTIRLRPVCIAYDRQATDQNKKPRQPAGLFSCP